MYVKYFGLSQSPFRTAPDPEYFFAYGPHLRAVDRVVHAIRERAGLVLILGEIGQGKTTVCRYIQKRYTDEFLIGYLGNPFLDAQEFGEQILLAFGLSGGAHTSKDSIRTLTEFLLEQERQGRIPVIFLDEAHLLSPDVLEFLLIVTNIQSRGKHLLQMVLAGQDEFQETLRHPRFASLNQRLGTRIQVRNFRKDEVIEYVRFRLDQAGGSGRNLFPLSTITRIWKVTRGNPRLVNQVCEHLLGRAYENRSQSVHHKDVDRLAKDPVFSPILFPQGRVEFPWGRVACSCCFFIFLLGISRSLHIADRVAVQPASVTFPVVHRSHANASCMPLGTEAEIPAPILAPTPTPTPASTSASTLFVGDSSPRVQENGNQTLGDTAGSVHAVAVIPQRTEVTNGSRDVQNQLNKILQLLEEREVQNREGERSAQAETGNTPKGSQSRKKTVIRTSSAQKKTSAPVKPMQSQEDTTARAVEGSGKASKSNAPRGDSSHPDPAEDAGVETPLLPVPPGISVDAIVWDTESWLRLAVVNEHIVKEGEVADDGYLVEKIYQTRVKFSKDGQIFEGRVHTRRDGGVQ